jgi:hypothetical protein
MREANFTKQDQCHQNCIHLWHRRLGHRDPEAVKKLCCEKLAEGIDIDTCDKLLKCTNCMKGKMARKHSRKSSTTSKTASRFNTYRCMWANENQTVGGKEVLSDVY